jgi:osmotically-inducible protein OsmY
MKKLIALLSSSLLLAALCITVTTHAKNAIQTGAAPAKSTKPMPPPPKSDSDIQKCIQDKLAKAKTLSTESITVIVANGEATLAGTVKKSGEKGGATNICKSCGASKVTNNITIEKVAKPTPTPKP